MRNILNGTTSRIAYSMDHGASSGTRGWWPFNGQRTQTQRPQDGNQQGQPNRQQGGNNNSQQQGNNQQAGNGGNNNSNGGGNGEGENEAEGSEYETFLRDNADLWEDKVEGNDSPSAEEVAETRRKKLETNNQQLRDYIGKLDFGLKIDQAKFAEAIEKGDPNYFQEVLSDLGKRVFAKQFDDFSRMMSSAEDRFKQYAQNIADTQVSARESENSLYEAVPIASNPVFKPIAMSIKSRALKKGQSDEQANETVRKAFKTMRNADPEALGLDPDEDVTVPANGRRITPSNNRRGKNNEPTDFVALLTNQQ